MLLTTRYTRFIAPWRSNSSATSSLTRDNQASHLRHAAATCRVCIAFIAHLIRSRPAACLSPSCCLAESNDRQLRQPRNNDRRRSETNTRRSEETLLASSTTSAVHVRHDAASLRDAIVRTTRCTRRIATTWRPTSASCCANTSTKLCQLRQAASSDRFSMPDTALE